MMMTTRRSRTSTMTTMSRPDDYGTGRLRHSPPRVLLLAEAGCGRVRGSRVLRNIL